jgi:hypothetical protein
VLGLVGARSLVIVGSRGAKVVDWNDYYDWRRLRNSNTFLSIVYEAMNYESIDRGISRYFGRRFVTTWEQMLLAREM